MPTNPAGVLERREFPVAAEAASVLPTQLADEHRPFDEGLAQGELVLQACTACGRARFPIGPVCPYCRTSEFRWESVRPDGIVHSWVRYHRSYLPEFEPLVPYVVLTVKLDDGPLLVGRLADRDVEPRIDMRARAIAERWADGRHVLAFAAAEPAS